MIRVLDEHHLLVGDRTWWGYYHAEDHDLIGGSMNNWRGRQFIVCFESGWSVSVIWGYCTYSDNHDAPFHEATFTETPNTVEAGVLFMDAGVVGDVLGYLDSEQLNVLIDEISKLHTGALWPST